MELQELREHSSSKFEFSEAVERQQHDLMGERRTEDVLRLDGKSVHIMIVEDEESGQIARMAIGPDGHLGAVAE